MCFSDVLCPHLAIYTNNEGLSKREKGKGEKRARFVFCLILYRVFVGSTKTDEIKVFEE